MKYIIVVIGAALIVHVLKISLEIINKKFSWRRLLGYGGMPSSHSALVASLATIVYQLEGFSVSFYISFILATVVMRDTIGLRGYLSTHGRIINKLIKDLPDDKEFKYPVMEETIAHSLSQVIVGALLGVLLTLWLI